MRPKIRKQGMAPEHKPRKDPVIPVCCDCLSPVVPLDKDTGRCGVCQEKAYRIDVEHRRQLEPDHRQVMTEPKFMAAEPAKPRELTMLEIRRGEGVDNLSRWRAQPWGFVREVLQAEPDVWQDEVLHALVGLGMDEKPLPKYYDRFALKACKGPGKSTLAAWVVLWFLTCFTDPKILATSITAENLRDGLWAEIAKWRNNSPMLIEILVWQSERIFMKERPETWFCSARTWAKDADKTKQANTLAGQHAQHTMIVLDEAGDIPKGVLAAGLAHHGTQGDDTEIHITLILGNPTAIDGALGFACIEDRQNWWVKEITGDPDAPDRAKRIDIEHARREIETWGRESPYVLVNIFGQFPPQQDNKLLGAEAVRQAMRITFPEGIWGTSPRLMGLDVARSLVSDRSTLCRRQGSMVFPFRSWRINDLMQLVGMVIWECREWEPDAIFVDMIGLGSGVLDRLRELGLPAIGVNSGLPPRDRLRFENKRAEMWWEAHLAVKGQGGIPGLALPDDGVLAKELCEPIVKFGRSGKLMIESKDDMKKRGVNSPDLADALVLTYAEPVFSGRARTPMESVVMLARQQAVRDETDYDPYKEGREEAVRWE